MTLLSQGIGKSEMGKEQENSEVLGTVREALPNALFRVDLEEGGEVLAYLAGKMRMHRIKVLVGDTVRVALDPYGGRARIVRRL